MYNKFLRNIQLRTLFFWLTLVGVAAGFTQLVLVTGARSCRALPTCIAAVLTGFASSCRVLAGMNRTLGLSDKLFVLVDSVLLTGLGRIMMMPSLVLAARVCPEVRTFRAWFGLCVVGPAPTRVCMWRVPSLLLDVPATRAGRFLVRTV